MPVYRNSRVVSLLALLLCLAGMVWLIASLVSVRSRIDRVCDGEAERARHIADNFINRLPNNIPSYPRGVLPADAPAAVYSQELVKKREVARMTLLDQNERSVYSVGNGTAEVYAPFPRSPLSAGKALMLEDRGGIALTVPVTRQSQVVATVGIILPLSAELASIDASRRFYWSGLALDAVLLVVCAFTLILNMPVSFILYPFTWIKGRLLRLHGAEPDIAAINESVAIITRSLQQNGAEALFAQQQQDFQPAEAEPFCSTEADVGETLSAIGESHGGLDVQSDVAIVGVQMKTALDSLSSQRNMDEIELISSCHEDTPPVAIMPEQLQLVLLNLLLNALDFMPGGGKLVVRAKYDRLQHDKDNITAAMVRIDVLDSGKGLSARQQNRIFSPDYRPRSLPRDVIYRLLQAKGLIEAAEGRLVLKSKPGKGSCFTIWLPPNPDVFR